MLMHKCLAFCVTMLLLLCLLLSCQEAGAPIPYDVGEHTHVYGYWYDATEENTEVRYCKICNAAQTRARGAED